MQLEEGVGTGRLEALPGNLKSQGEKSMPKTEWLLFYIKRSTSGTSPNEHGDLERKHGEIYLLYENLSTLSA